MFILIRYFSWKGVNSSTTGPSRLHECPCRLRDEGVRLVVQVRFQRYPSKQFHEVSGVHDR